MKNHPNLLTVGELLERFFEKNHLDSKKRKRSRSDFNKIPAALAHPLGAKMPAAELPKDREELASRCNSALPAPSVSRYLQVVRWGIERGLVEPRVDLTAELGFPQFSRQAMTAEWRMATVVYEAALRIASARRIYFNKSTKSFWLDVFRAHTKSRPSGRADVNAFIRVWRKEADAGRVPKIEFPLPPSKKPQTYRAEENEIPEIYQPGLDAIHSWLKESLVKGRGKKQKKKSISIQQQLNNLYRFFGYFINVNHEDISGLGWESLFSKDRVLEFIFYTDPEAAQRTNGHRYSSGVYQEGFFNTFIDFLSGPLELPEAAKAIANLKRQFLFERKRDPIPETLTPNDFFALANQLLDQADLEEKAGHLIQASVLRRDALLIVLTMLWPRRVNLWHGLKLKNHIQITDGAPIRICLRREESKPNKADQVLEIPPEVEGLFRQYLEVDRPRLIGDRNDDGNLFIAQGGSGAKCGTPRIAFRNRTREFLKIELGTHALRKIWASRYLEYSHGDYLTVMTILDTSMTNVVNAYRDGQDRSAAKEYTDTTDALAKQILEGELHDESK